MSRVTATRAQIEAQLRALGVRPGAPLMVHASLRAIGPVEGGADGLLDAIDASLAGGTIVIVLGADPDEPFDAHTTPAHEDMGALAEVFRQRPGTRVNDHAASRWAARGPDAAALLEPMPLHDYHGPGSVLDRFTAADGQVLRLGADRDTVTLTHLAEYRADIANKRRVSVTYTRADTGAQRIDSLDDNDGIVDWSDEAWTDGDYFTHILVDFLATGGAAVGPVGECQAELLSARAFVDHATRWIETHLRQRSM